MKIEVTANWWPIGFPVQEASRRLAGRIGGRHSYNGGHVVATRLRRAQVEAAVAEVVAEMKSAISKP